LTLRNCTARQDVFASVIIPTCNRAAYLQDIMRCVSRQTIPGDQYEIIVVDNGSTDDTYQIMAPIVEQDRTVHYLQESRIGLHNARHAGARVARSEVLVYVDDDVIMQPEWLKAILKPFEDPLVAVVGGKILPKWEAEPPAWLDQFGRNGGVNLSVLDLGDETLELAWPQTVYGCNMSVRKSVLFEIGGFNPDAIGDYRLIWLRGDGETGLHQKIYDAGYRVIYEPRAWLYHRVPASRLEQGYFFWRAFIQGISDSYTHMRTNRSSAIQLLLHAGSCIVRAAQAYTSSLRLADRRIYWRAKSWYWYGRCKHQLRLASSQSLRNYVLQERYLK
jgi:glycosyltransferase involved in cell wall biosynthesis